MSILFKRSIIITILLMFSMRSAVAESLSGPLIIKPQTNYYYVASGLFILVLAGIAYHLRGKLFRKKKEYTLEELELEKRKIFQAIRGFEKHAVGESSEEYMKLMDEYRQKGIDVIMKIDKKSNQLSKRRIS